MWWIVDWPVVVGHAIGCNGGGLLWVWWVGLWLLVWIPIEVVCDVLVVDGGVVGGFVVFFFLNIVEVVFGRFKYLA